MAKQPNANQKIMSSEEKDIIRANNARRKEDNADSAQAIRKAEVAVFEKEKENLPTLIERRKNELASALESELKPKGLTAPTIYRLLSWQGAPNTSRGYSGTELMIAKEGYQIAIEMINEKVHYVPSISSFCNYVGISSALYKNYMASPNEPIRNAILMIDDYIKGVMLDAATTRNTDNMTSVFRAKAEHGMTEANAPQIIEYKSSIDVQEIRDKIKNMRVIDADYKEK